VSGDHLAVAAVIGVIARVDTDDVKVARARKEVPPATLPLSCKFRALLCWVLVGMCGVLLTNANSRGGYGRGRGAPPS